MSYVRDEGRLKLQSLRDTLLQWWSVKKELPAGKAGPTPAVPCSSAPDHLCRIETGWYSDPIWRLLDFEVTEPDHFQYTYESDGRVACATAVGDPECTGARVELVLTFDTRGPFTKSMIMEQL